jgi:hypothetical protein
MSLLTMCQAAAAQLSVTVPSLVMLGSDDTSVILRRLADEEGLALMGRYPWQALQREHTFTTTAADTQTGGIPSDFDRVIPDTVFNRNTRRRVAGPLSPDEWAQTKASLVTYVNPTFRIRTDAFLMTPNPPAGETVAYEYISKNFCKSSGGTGQAAWAADSDLGVLDERLMTLGLVWRFRQAKGLPYGEDLALYERRVADAQMRDGGGKARISGDPAVHDRVATRLQVPETWVI